MALALFLPGLLMQDGWRFAFFARSRGDLAFFNDLTWAGILLLELAVLSQVGVAGSLQVGRAWGLAGTCATLLGTVQGRTVPDPRLAYGWWREHRDIGPRYLASELAAMATVQLVVYIVGAVAGLVAAGSLRAAQVLIGPINIMTMGVYLVVIPQAAGPPHRSTGLPPAVATDLGLPRLGDTGRARGHPGLPRPHRADAPGRQLAGRGHRHRAHRGGRRRPLRDVRRPHGSGRDGRRPRAPSLDGRRGDRHGGRRCCGRDGRRGAGRGVGHGGRRGGGVRAVVAGAASPSNSITTATEAAPTATDPASVERRALDSALRPTAGRLTSLRGPRSAPPKHDEPAHDEYDERDPEEHGERGDLERQLAAREAVGYSMGRGADREPGGRQP